jgi:hypothetical protein
MNMYFYTIIYANMKKQLNENYFLMQPNFVVTYIKSIINNIRLSIKEYR